MVSYVTVEQADSYFADRLDAEVWESLEDVSKKRKALATASKRVDMQPLIGRKSVDTQVPQFPRQVWTRTCLDGQWADIGTPQSVLDAVCEEALFLLSMTDWDKKRERQQALGVVGQGIGDGNEYAQQTVVSRKTTAEQGLLSPTARSLMSAYIQRGGVMR